ncbi:Pms1-like protein [Giardia lamblia P15]|uniref:Pms1-like protein n=1 Tax=Giardia intestinalis (strain P15) TaxID=658858 RepID=E1F1X8_GIAIA|nr:Pms1-like protein [Giardia lamblia P15]
MDTFTKDKAEAGRIRSLPASDSRLILATQQFPDPHKVISALLENSLDAGASEISIVLESMGIKSITVNDNGCGLDLPTLQALGSCRITTAIPQPGMVNHKGESIFLISALGTVLVTSSLGDDPYERVISENTSNARQATRASRGTTVVVQNLYKSIPVRQKYFSTPSLRKKLLLSITDLVQSYALANYTLGFRLIVDETVHIDVSSAPENSIHDRYVELFGREVRSLVGFFSFETRLGYTVKASLACPDTGITSQTKLGHARKIFLSTNGKPILCSSLIEALQQTYARTSATNIPIGALNLVLPPGTYALARSTPYDTLQIQGLNLFVDLLSEEYLAWLLRYNNSTITDRYIERSTTSKSLIVKAAKGKSANSPYSKSSFGARSHQKDAMPDNIIISRVSHTKAASFFHTRASELRQVYHSETTTNTELCSGGTPSTLGTIGLSELQTSISNPQPHENLDPIKIEGQSCDSEGKVRIGPVRRRGSTSGFRQQDFANLKYICQYNQSFLIAQLNNVFYLIDQHAAHEAKHFSNYWHNPHCYLSKQKTITPLRLILRPDEKLCLEEFLSSVVFDTIGFELRMSENHVLISSFPSLFGQTLTEEDFREYLLSLYGYTREYVESICTKDTGSKTRENSLLCLLHNNIAPPKIRKIFASKSCKASIRLGDPLLDSTAKRVIADLASCEKPFNCPHGRPVLRLLDLAPRLDSANEDLPHIEESHSDVINSED